MSSQIYPVPLSERRPVPAFARAWGQDVDYPAPGLITDELQQNIHIDSIFVKQGELIIPDKCEECRLRAKGCDRARPLCGRCEKIGKPCVPVTTGFTRLRKGRGGKALPLRVWGQAEDPEKVEREREMRLKLERERMEKEAAKARETKAPPTFIVSTGPPAFSHNNAASPTRKRKREPAAAQSTQAQISSLPPSKGHYVDYTSFTIAYTNFAATTVQVSTPLPIGNPNDIPIDPLLLDMSYSVPNSPIQPSTSPSIEPTIKRPKKSTSPPPSRSTGTGASTPLSIDPELRLQSSAAPSTSRRSSSLPRTSNSSPLSPLDTPSALSKSTALPSPSPIEAQSEAKPQDQLSNRLVPSILS